MFVYTCNSLQLFRDTRSGTHSVSINTSNLLILDTSTTVIQNENPDL
jgi:hypothetical protein